MAKGGAVVGGRAPEVLREEVCSREREDVARGLDRGERVSCCW